MPLLWQLELNYFHWMPADLPWPQARSWIADWLEHAPKDGHSQSWNPFGVAQRVLRWTRLIRGPWWDDLEVDPLRPALLRSLYAQCRFLAHHQEKELLGNHLLKTACALYAGARFFAGSEADGWLRLATVILRDELEVQILADGGHYERSPMYHLMVMVDLIDAYNITPINDRFAQVLRPSLEAMYRFASACSHGDGEIPLFNDSVLAQAPRRPEVLSYAERVCGFAPGPAAEPGFIALPEFGLFRLGDRRTALWLDAGATGPPFLQAHAHADTGSFELSVDQLRIVCDRGVYSYQERNYRALDRSTPAHSTVSVAGENSSDCWGSFRVARRARIRAIEWAAGEGGAEQSVTFRHDGFRHLPGSPVHERRVGFDAGAWCYTIRDRIEGRGASPLRCDSFLYLGPGVTVLPVASGGCPVVGGSEPAGVWVFELGHAAAPDLSLRVTVQFLGARIASVFPEPAMFAPAFHTEQAGARLRAACLAEHEAVEIRWTLELRSVRQGVAIDGSGPGSG